MLRLDAPSGQRLVKPSHLLSHYGGSEANVCVVLAQLGIDTQFVTALPDNPIGQGAVAELHSLAVGTRGILHQGERMGIYFHEPGNGIRPSKIYYDREHSSFSQLTFAQQNWSSLLENQEWLHWSGITPALGENSASLCRSVLAAARSKGLRISADLNYRSTLWKYGKTPKEVMPELLQHCELINGDLEALQTYLGIQTDPALSPVQQFESAAQQLRKLLPNIKMLAMSFRDQTPEGHMTYQGALHAEGKSFFTETYVLSRVTDRIGSGDAFMAGLLYGVLQQESARETIAIATACAILKHAVWGDFLRINKEEIDEFLKNGLSYKVTR